MEKKTPQSYQQAWEELSLIMDSIQNPATDLAEVAGKVQRAVELIACCRSYLRNLQSDIDNMIKDDLTRQQE